MADSEDGNVAQRQAELDRRQAAKPAPRQVDLLGEQAPPGGLKPVHIAIGAVALALVLSLVIWTLSGKTISGRPGAALAPPSLPASAAPVATSGVQIDLSSSSPAPVSPVTAVPDQAAPAPMPAPVLQAAPQPRPRRAGVRRDAWLCVHGDQNDYRTIAACDRKDAALGRGGE